MTGTDTPFNQDSTNDSFKKYPFLLGGGELGELTRQYNWSQSPLGTPDQWPHTLRVTLGILLHSAFPMFLFWGDDLICFYNDAYRSGLGTTGQHPAVGKRGQDAWGDVWNFIGPLIHQVMTTGESVRLDDQLVPFYRNGQLDNSYWTSSYNPVYADNGQISGVFVTCTETTQRVATINQLQVSEQRFQNLVREVSAGITLLMGDEMRVEVVNQAYARLINRSPEELHGKPLFSLIPEAEETFRPIIDTVRQTGEPLYLNDQPYFVYSDGQKKEGFLNLVYQPYKESDGTISGVMVLCQDVTEQVVGRRQLAESETRYRRLIEEAPIATCLFVGRELVIQVANQSMLTIWGKGDTPLGKPLAEALPELKGQPFLPLLDTLFTTGNSYQAKGGRGDLIIDGVLQTYYFDYSFTPLRNAAGEVYAIMEMAEDVTEQVMARQQVEESETRFRQLIQQAPAAILVVKGEDLVIETINEAMLAIMGRENDVTGKPLEVVMPELIGQNLPVRCREVLHTGTPYHGWADEAQVQRNGQLETGYYNVAYTPLYEAGVITGVMQVATEVTEQVKTRQALEASENRFRRLSEQLEVLVQERTEELATVNEELQATNENLASANEEYAAMNEELGATAEELTESNELLTRSNENLQRFAYVASHDLQEPLRKIEAFGDLLKEQYSDALGSGIDYLNRMQVAARRMSTLIRDLLNFSRIATQLDVTEPVPLNNTVQLIINDLDLVVQETGAVIEVAPLPTILGDPLQLSQLFQNLLTNALKFHRPGIPPRIQVTYDRVPAAGLPVSVKPARSVEAYHHIAVVDNGIGFDEKYLDRIFQVFQRLHGRSEFAGTGIGLAICEKVAANHGGAITAASQPGQGATFSIYLPA